MIQRIQSIYLLLAALATLACMCFSVGQFDTDGTVTACLTNLYCGTSCGTADFAAAPMFAVLALSTVVSLRAIFVWNNRRDQAKLCTLNILLIVCWHILYAVLAHVLAPESDNATFCPTLPAALPLIAAILSILARRAINKDEALVRAADRIR